MSKVRILETNQNMETLRLPWEVRSRHRSGLCKGSQGPSPTELRKAWLKIMKTQKPREHAQAIWDHQFHKRFSLTMIRKCQGYWLPQSPEISHTGSRTGNRNDASGCHCAGRLRRGRSLNPEEGF